MMNFDVFVDECCKNGFTFKGDVIHTKVQGEEITFLPEDVMPELCIVNVPDKDLGKILEDTLTGCLKSFAWYNAYSTHLHWVMTGFDLYNPVTKPELLSYQQFIIYLSHAAYYILTDISLYFYIGNVSTGIDTAKISVDTEDSVDRLLMTFRAELRMGIWSEESKEILRELYEGYVNNWIIRYYDRNPQVEISNNICLYYDQFIMVMLDNMEAISSEDLFKVEIGKYTMLAHLDRELWVLTDNEIESEISADPYTYTCVDMAYKIYVKLCQAND